MTKKLAKKYKRIFVVVILMALLSASLPLLMRLQGKTYPHIIVIQLILLTLWFIIFFMFWTVDMLKKVKSTIL